MLDTNALDVLCLTAQARREALTITPYTFPYTPPIERPHEAYRRTTALVEQALTRVRETCSDETIIAYAMSEFGYRDRYNDQNPHVWVHVARSSRCCVCDSGC